MRWGFDTDSIEHWADATGRRKIITIESEEQLICELARSMRAGGVDCGSDPCVSTELDGPYHDGPDDEPPSCVPGSTPRNGP